ncbi:MAG: 30S ribosomal protein S20 [bacterium]
MANTKTAKKQILVSRRNHERNVHFKTMLKTSIKKARTAMAGEDKEAAKAALDAAVKRIYKSATKRLIKKQNASRKVSRLMLAFNRQFGEKAEA